MLDTLTAAEKLRDAGMPYEQAKGFVRALFRAQEMHTADYLADDLRAAGFKEAFAEDLARLYAEESGLKRGGFWSFLRRKGAA
jgi:hypothetical protein